MNPSPSSFSKPDTSNWRRPNEVMQLHKLKVKKKQLQTRLNLSTTTKPTPERNFGYFPNSTVSSCIKRKNPFVKDSETKRTKSDNCIQNLDISCDQTLFKLLNLSNTTQTNNDTQPLTSFTNLLNQLEEDAKCEKVQVNLGKPWIPIDWSLKSKMRFMAPKPFVWNQKLKISEEASGITGFVRCLDVNTQTNLDMSPNSRFHQCCLYWQQPVLPWLNLFPRSVGRASAAGTSVASTETIRESLQTAWADSVRSLFQLVRTGQCPYFYACANKFTVLFRAAGICGYSTIHSLVTPTTRGFRHLLRRESIKFTMPLKKKRMSDMGSDMLDSTVTSDMLDAEEDEPPDEQWLQSLGINEADIMQINYTQAKITQKAECQVDNSEQSLVFIESMNVFAFYNFLINCKGAVESTGPLAGIPPTLLAPVAFQGATLCSLKARENKVNVDNTTYNSLELSGPILPHTIHTLCKLHPSERSFTAIFAGLPSTLPFNKVKPFENGDNLSTKENKDAVTGREIFSEENLSDCGINGDILKHFCSINSERVSSVESIEYSGDSKTFTWS